MLAITVRCKLHDDLRDQGETCCPNRVARLAKLAGIKALIDFEGPDAGCIINGSVLVTLDRFVVFAFECQELHIDLDLVAWNLLLISDGV